MKLFMAMVTLVLMTNTFAEEKKDTVVGQQPATATTCKDILDSQQAKGSIGKPNDPSEAQKKDSSQ